MTTLIRILTTSTLDSSSAVLLISPTGSKTLVNCGEGCQRSFLESGGLKIRSVTRVCLTHIGHDSIGGLPGMMLTTADAAASEASFLHTATKADPKTNKRKSSTPVRCEVDHNGSLDQQLEIFGPQGTQSFLHSLRHFMRRDRLKLFVYEGNYNSAASGKQKTKTTTKQEKPNDQDGIRTDFHVQTIPTNTSPTDQTLDEQQATSPSNTAYNGKRMQSYLFTTPPVPGKFLIEKARELGIPPGPLYSKLKSGQSIIFVHPVTKEEITVEPNQVVATGNSAVTVAIIYCPHVDVLQQLVQSETLNSFKDEATILDIMVHMTPKLIYKHPVYQEWIKSFGNNVSHMTLHPTDKLSSGDTPFYSAALGAMTRSLLHEELYPNPFPNLGYEREETAVADANHSGIHNNTICGLPFMEYVLIPRSKKGLTKAVAPNGISLQERDICHSVAQESGAIALANKLMTCWTDEFCVEKNDEPLGELLFTGTGSGLPCKHRNVTGMYLRFPNGNAMLLDVGEGTTGQLFRSWNSDEASCTNFDDQLRKIKAIWISHPHADHHLGLLRFLAERNAAVDAADPVVLMAPPAIIRFLKEYSAIDSSLERSYIALDCIDMTHDKPNPLGQKLFQELGITWCASVPVVHCPHSYAIVMDGTAFGRFVYSGDCRPSERLAEIAQNADLLVHEATFEDGMEDEAMWKQHCTVGEAVGIGRKMKAKAMVLTHFSQRYPKIPPLRKNKQPRCESLPIQNNKEASDNNDESVDSDNISVAFAFDFMKVKPSNIMFASKLTPALRLLYPEEEEDNTEEMTLSFHHTAKDRMSKPGEFGMKGTQ